MISKQSSKIFWWLIILAIASLFLTLKFSFIGEEGVYTISSYEMHFYHHYLFPTLYGATYGRPPLYNWLIILGSDLIGWAHSLVVARFVTACATLGTAGIVFWLARNVSAEKNFPLFAALAYLTTDAFLYHGWIAYSDPLFAFGIATAIACLWVAHERESYFLLSIGLLALVAGFLTKAVTAYAFYVIALLWLLWRGKRQFFLRPISIILHILAFSVPIIWALITRNANGSNLIHDIIYWGWQSTQQIHSVKYFGQLLLFPGEIFLRILPVSLFAGIVLFVGDRSQIKNDFSKFVFWVVVINLIPYWLSPHHAIRYVLPLYPFMAIWCAQIVWQAQSKYLTLTCYGFIAAIILKYILVFFWWPYFQANYRGDYNAISDDVIKYVQTAPLYVDAIASAYEHSVIDLINVKRYPVTPATFFILRTPSAHPAYLFTAQKQGAQWQLIKVYNLGKSDLVLNLYRSK